MSSKTIFILAISLSALTACGGSGGSSGSNGQNTTAQLLDPARSGQSCADTPSTTSPYLITSYYSCGEASSNLGGLWMLVAEYDVIANNYHFDGTLRMGLTISPVADDTLSVTSCGYFRDGIIAKKQYNISADADFIDIEDPVTGATIQMSVDDNLHLSGQHTAASAATITSSTAAARKISADHTKRFALLDLQFELNGQAYTGGDLPIDCFAQYVGERQSYLVNTIPAGSTENWEETSFTTHINYREQNEAAHLLLITPDEQEVEGASLIFSSGEAISNLKPAADSTDSFELLVEQDDQQGIIFNTVYEDLGDPENTAAFGAEFAF